MVILTKETLLKGVNNIKKVELETVDGSVYIRPLNHSEVTHYNSITAKALGDIQTDGGRRKGVSANFKINLEKSTLATSEAQAYAVATSLSCKEQEWSEGEVQKLDGALFNEIFKAVAELSGLDTDVESEVDNFLEDS